MWQLGDGSGPRIARLYHRLLAGVLLVAWASLASQIEILIGSRGLLPLAPIHEQLPPSLFRWIAPSDVGLTALCWVGAGLAAVALIGLVPRVLAAVQIVLYASTALACRDFLGFQWDNLLLECLLLAVVLPRHRPSRLAHFLFRFLLFKLYVESGVAKWQSHLSDWQDGSAMTYYYETAPLPTWLAWYAHQLPAWWHHLESRAVLVLELVVPLGFFGPRLLRYVALASLTGFQLVNLATANYGFFVYLALALHVFLLDEKPALIPPPPPARWKTAALAGFAAVYLALSLLEGWVAFADRGHAVARAVRPVRALYAPYRLVNTYHLFGHITRERIEPEFQTTNDGQTWFSHHLRWKPGPTRRAPPFVAPHQPRVDFLLWFFGLDHDDGVPDYVAVLLARMCHDPDAVAELFTEPVAPGATAVRILYFDTHFAPPAAHDEGEWWTRTPRGQTGDIPCARLR